MLGLLLLYFGVLGLLLLYFGALAMLTDHFGVPRNDVRFDRFQ